MDNVLRSDLSFSGQTERISSYRVFQLIFTVPIFQARSPNKHVCLYFLPIKYVYSVDNHVRLGRIYSQYQTCAFKRSAIQNHRSLFRMTYVHKSGESAFGS